MIQISYRDPRPIYEQVKDGFRQLILSGVMRPDERMPSVRELATQLAINPNTIQRAYRELEQEGCICSVPGKGSFVADARDTAALRRKELLVQLKEISEELKKLGVDDKKVILYAPTWRDNQHTSGEGYTYKTEVDFDKLREDLGDEYVILFRAHYLVANSFDFDKYKGFVEDVSSYSDINDLYIAADILITDYSSVFFDYANLRKPVIFYMYDLEEYANELRGFYFSLDELPGPIVRDEDALISEVKACDGWQPDEKYEEFCAKYNPKDDGHASERVLKRIIK